MTTNPGALPSLFLHFLFPPTQNLCSYCLMCPFATIRSLSFSLYPNLTNFLFVDLHLFPNIMLCLLHSIDCFIYFKALPAKCRWCFEVMVLFIWHSVNWTVRSHKEGSVKVLKSDSCCQRSFFKNFCVVIQNRIKPRKGPWVSNFSFRHLYMCLCNVLPCAFSAIKCVIMNQ